MFKILKTTAAAVLAAAAFVPASASAGDAFSTGTEPGASSFSVTRSTDQAGAHPDVTVDFAFTAEMYAFTYGLPRTADVALPAGMLGDPNVAEQCTRLQFVRSECPAGAQIGEVTTNLLGFSLDTNPVWNLVPMPTEPARLGLTAAGALVEVPIAVRSDGDYGLTSPSVMPPGWAHSVSLTLWGVPSDHGVPGVHGAYMVNPTRCGDGELTSKLGVTLWSDPDWHRSYDSSMPRPTGCDAVPFDPSVTVKPETTRADAPSGYDVSIKLPIGDDPTSPTTSHIRRAAVTLPEGVSMSPSAANRLDGCTPAQIKLGSNDDETCSPESRVGTVEIDSPPLPGPISGNAYLAAPTADHPYRIYTVAKGYGLTVKLTGDVLPDARTGQLTTVFDNLPETPVRSFTLKLKGGDGAVLTNPQTCGTKAVTTEITPWSGTAARTPGTTVTYDGCESARPVDFTAGMETTQAGAAGAFALSVSRADRQPALDRIDVRLPSGVTAKLAGVPLCPAANAAQGTCDASTQVGTTDVLAGPGGSPFGLGGKVYFTEGYDGAPFGLSIVVPAKAGPFDLGVVNVRAKVSLDPVTAQLRVESEPLPQILQGIPLKLRRIALRIDRADFMRNGTSCAPAKVEGVVGGLAVSSPLQLTGCAALPFAPKLTATFTGGRYEVIRKRGYPGLDVTLTTPGSGANLGGASVTLPAGVAANLPALQNQCSAAQVAARACPESSRIGWAKATTPLLDTPLAGPVYAASPTTGTIPRVVALLDGRIPLTVIGDNTVLKTTARLRSTFRAPDVPVSSFTLSLKSGKTGLLATSRSMCKDSTRRIPAALTSHAGTRVDRTITIGATCTAAPKKATKKARAAKRTSR
jgi:hypothetical protein